MLTVHWRYCCHLVPKYPYEANKFQNLGLIAGGTGITPMVNSTANFVDLFEKELLIS